MTHTVHKHAARHHTKLQKIVDAMALKGVRERLNSHPLEACTVGLGVAFRGDAQRESFFNVLLDTKNSSKSS